MQKTLQTVKWSQFRTDRISDPNCLTLRLCFWNIFSSPEPKANGWAKQYTNYSGMRSSSVCQHFLTSSLKPLCQLNSSFIWILLRMREQMFVQMVLVTWPRWPPCPYRVKPFKNLLQNQRADDLWTWYVALGIWVYQVCSNDDPMLTLTYFTSRLKGYMH